MSLQNYLNNSGLLFNPQDIIDFHLALKTAPLVILTGISGSGKTKLAQNYIDYMCIPTAITTINGTPRPQRQVESHRYKFVSVRSDWLDSKGLLGYYNPLLGIYYSTPVLELLLDAALEPDEPYFIILDEMNLAKAEYYFADFLSALESRRLSNGVIISEPIELHKAGGLVLSKSYSNEIEKNEALRHLSQLPVNIFVNVLASGEREYFIPEQVQIPSNVYIVGTINIDETTYRFSPKIIDRAHVIEMNGESARDYFLCLTGTGSISNVVEYSSLNLTLEDLTFDRCFVSNITEAGILLDCNIQNSEVSKIIDQLWCLLSDTQFRFSYRTINRMLHYIYNGIQLYANSGIDIDTTIVYKLIDSEILLKILPRIHGNRKILEGLLANLIRFCSLNYSDDELVLEKNRQNNHDFKNNFNDIDNLDNFRFPRSAIKISKIARDIQKLNYGSFI